MKFLHLTGWLLLTLTGYAQHRPVFRLDSLSDQGELLDKGWKFKPGDNPAWATVEYDDRHWQSINPTPDIYEVKPLWNTTIGWFRLRFSIDSALRQESLALLVEQTGASEIYLNGRLIGRFGQISHQPERVKAASPPYGEFISLQPGQATEQVLAVRFALQKDIPYIQFDGRPNPTLILRVMNMRAVTQKILNDTSYLDYLKMGLFFILAVMHLALFWFYPAQKANLYFFIFSILIVFVELCYVLAYYHVQLAATRMYLLIAVVVLWVLSLLCCLQAIYTIFGQRRGLIYWLLASGFLFSFPPPFWFHQGGWFVSQTIIPLLIYVESARISILAERSQQKGARIFIVGSAGFLLFNPLFHLFAFGFLPAGPNWVFGNLAFNLGFYSLPIATSLYLALESSFANRSLAAKLVEVQQLSEANLAQQREKQQWQELDTLKSRFFANLSHEFRTPLALIRGIVEKLQRHKETAEERQTNYQLIDRNAGQLLQMINQLLDLSKLEAGKLALHPEPAEVSTFLQRLAGSFVSLFESKGIAYQYTAPLQPRWVAMDSPKLEQILSNLLSNAAKFTPKGGAVRFAASFETYSLDGGLLRVVIQDTGIGIAAGELERIFERFYQADSSVTRSYEGSGIGLSLVKELVGLHGGEVKVESTPEQGTSFIVQLPLALATPGEEVASEQSSRLESPLEAPTPLQEATAKKTLPNQPNPQAIQILVIEDHAELRQFIGAALGEKYAVQQAENGLEGYQSALEGLPDLIISDVMMPGMDGISLCQKLKTDERTSHIPVILLTAKAGMESKLAGPQNGADDYLTKPFRLEELLVRVSNLLESRRTLRERYRQQITLNPKEITVTSTDEQFLQRALSIMENNMANADFDVETFSREIGMSRSQLHRKLSALTDQGPSDFIRTLRLKRAAVLLQSQVGNVSDVAYLVGFTNLPYFSKAFRDYFGQTPSEYAQQKVAD